MLPGDVDQLAAALLLDVGGGVHDGAPAGREPLARDVVEDVEGVAAGALVVLVVGDQAAAEVAGDDLGRLEVPAGEGGLAGAGRADQDHEGQVGDGQGAPLGGVVAGHAAFSSFVVVGVAVVVARVKTAIWVGGPTSGSSGPTGVNSTSYPCRPATWWAQVLELLPGPLEAVVAMAGVAGREGLPADVDDVRRRHQDRTGGPSRRRRTPGRSGRGVRRPREHGGVVPLEAVVGVRERSLE